MLDDERVRARVTEIAAAAQRASIALGAWVASAEALAALSGVRLRYVIVGSDLQLLRAGIASTLTATRRALA